MSPLTRLYLEIAGVAVLIGAFYGYQHHEQNIGYQRCEKQVKDAQAAEITKLHDYQEQHQLQADEADRKAEYEKHHLPPVITSPIILQNGRVCTGTMPVLPASAGLPTTEQSTQSGPGERNIRPGIEAFKLRYETALIVCRDSLAKWPKEQK